MQVASVSTRDPTVRSEIDGWTFEDASLLARRSLDSNPHGKIFIGYTPAPKDIPHYGCILEMLADGWELLGPPQREEFKQLAPGWELLGPPQREEFKQHVQWSWWLKRKLQRRIPA
jgi:hypothetical protein